MARRKRKSYRRTHYIRAFETLGALAAWQEFDLPLPGFLDGPVRSFRQQFGQATGMSKGPLRAIAMPAVGGIASRVLAQLAPNARIKLGNYGGRL